ncbi:hypothetical protein [Ensifer adhaerens]|uniref:hypothetical protein n=1 Tax=Ensifer adhaerens TaxID=106592 RepID=UPI000B07930A|nr:hypothetical protein [Ensifer adhaerens]
MSTEYREFMQRNVDAYRLFFEIEIILRELITAKLKEKFGHKWQKQGLPEDVRKRVTEGLIYERGIGWDRRVAHTPLYYSDFPHLRKLIEMTQNWPMFSGIFDSKSGTTVPLADLEVIRNNIAHVRYLSDAELSILNAAHTKIISSIPEAELEQCKESAGLHIPVVRHVTDLSLLFGEITKTMQLGAAFESSDASLLNCISEWWFDSDYLGVSIDDCERFSGLCLEYIDIPRGIGQAVVRRNWVISKDAVSIGQRSVGILKELLSKLEVYNA